jgi:hypothetical protein
VRYIQKNDLNLPQHKLRTTPKVGKHSDIYGILDLTENKNHREKKITKSLAEKMNLKKIVVEGNGEVKLFLDYIL